LGGVGTFGVVACVQEVVATPSELLAGADLIHHTMGAREMRSAEWRMRNAEWASRLANCLIILPRKLMALGQFHEPKR
jgi:hypothetical protein